MATPSVMRLRSSNAGVLVILLGLIVPLLVLWHTDILHRTVLGWGLVSACLVVFTFVYVEICELNKVTGLFRLRSMGVLRNRVESFPLSEITQVNIKSRDFGGGYRTGNPYAFQLTITKASGKEIKLTGWRSSTNTQQRGFEIAEFLGVPFDTTS